MKHLQPGIALVTVLSLFFQSLPLLAASPPQSSSNLRAKTDFSFVDETGEAQASQYVMRRYPGERLVPVRILAGVKSPGIYYLPEGTDFLTAVALSGGLTATADPDKITINRWATQQAQELKLEDVVEQPKSRNPVLAANDVVFIGETQPWISTNTVSVIAVVASLIGILVGAKALTSK